MNKREIRQTKPTKTDWGKSLPLLAGFIILAVGGYLLLNGNGSKGTFGIILSIGFIVLWLVLDVISVRNKQWFPLLITGFYWLITSLTGLFIGEVGNKGFAVFLKGVATFAATPLKGLNQVFGDLGLLAMAGLTLAALIALIMVLDQNKPNLAAKNDTSSDSSDWF